MNLTTSITPSEVAVAMGVSVPASDSQQYKRWEMWIADALMLIQIRLNKIDPEKVLDEDHLDYVVREAVAAHAARPDNATQVNVSHDDTSVSKTYQSGTGRVQILPEWWTLLGLSDSAGEAYAVDTTGGTGNSSGHSPICSIYFGSSNCSCGAYLTVGQYPLYETEGYVL